MLGISVHILLELIFDHIKRRIEPLVPLNNERDDLMGEFIRLADYMSTVVQMVANTS